MIERLSHSDFGLLLDAIAELNSDIPETLPERAVASASKIICADTVAFTGFSYSGEFEGLMWNNSEALVPETIEVFAEYYTENPLVDALITRRGTETLRITDIMPAKEFQRTNVYNEFYKKVGVTNQLVAPLAISEDSFMSCSINTIKEDFSDRDKLILTLIAPHYANAVRNAFAYNRLVSALETENCGIVAINSKDVPLYVSNFARRLFEAYFAKDTRGANSLPESINFWLKQVDAANLGDEFKLPPAPLKIADPHGELTIRLMPNNAAMERTLLLEEKRIVNLESFKRFNLTKREGEILGWIAQGKTDDAIKTLLDISLRTVHKHVENIYIKLGVETRIAAMMKASETL